MKGPVCKYPKQPTGPSGFGGSGVRRVQSYGGDFQRTRPDSSTLSIKAGDFSRVIIEDDPQYITQAYIGKTIVRDTMDYRRPFRRSIATQAGNAASGGLYINNDVSGYSAEPFPFGYTIYSGTTDYETFNMFVYTAWAEFGGYYRRGKKVGIHTVYYSTLPTTPGNSQFYRYFDGASYWGVHPEHGRCSATMTMMYSGRIDVAGRPLSDPTFYRHLSKAAGQKFHTDIGSYTREDAEFTSITGALVLKYHTVGICAELFFRPGPVVPGDYAPKFWIMATPNTSEFGVSISYSDATGSILNSARIPSPSTSPVPHYTVTSGRLYGFDISATMHTMRVAAASDSEFVLALQVRISSGWVSRVSHVIISSSGYATVSVVEESAVKSSRSSLDFWQDIAHLGNGVLLAKVVAGATGTDHSVAFRLSTDRGMSWGAPFFPTGFDAPLYNQYFGSFRVHKPITEEPGLILVVSWNPSDGSYYMYSSEDNGATWKRLKKVYVPDEFYRIDTMLADDGGGNFDDIEPGPIYSDVVDVTLPERYKERS